MVAVENLIRETEFIAELAKIEITITGRMLRNYVVLGLLPAPAKIPGEGNVLYYDPSWIERVKVIRRLVLEGESLADIKKILSSAKASDKEILDYVTTRDYLETRRYAIKLLRDGKDLRGTMKDEVIAAKEKFRESFDKRYGKGRYERLIDDYFHILSKYTNLYPPGWKREDVLDYFGFAPEDVDFEDRRAVKEFKMNFYKKLVNFLKGKEKYLEGEIELYEKAVKSYERDIKEG